MEAFMNWKVAGMAGTAIVTLALTGVSAVAGANKFTGNVSLAVGETFQDELNGTFDGSFASITGDANLNIAFSNNINLQLGFNGVGSFSDSTGGFDLDRDSAVQADAHLYYRNDQYAAGVFGGVGVESGIAATAPGQSADVYFVGVEGQYYWKNFTFGLNAGYLDSSTDSFFGAPTDVFLNNAWFVGGEVRWYATPKVTLTANVGYIDGEAVFGTADTQTYNWGLKAEYWPEEKEPLSLWVAYEGRTSNVDFGTNDIDKDTHTVKVGVTFHFGVEGGKQEQDKSGPAFNTMDYGAVVVGG